MRGAPVRPGTTFRGSGAGRRAKADTRHDVHGGPPVGLSGIAADERCAMPDGSRRVCRHYAATAALRRMAEYWLTYTVHRPCLGGRCADERPL